MLCEIYQGRGKILLNLPLWTSLLYTVPAAVARVPTGDLSLQGAVIRSGQQLRLSQGVTNSGKTVFTGTFTSFRFTRSVAAMLLCQSLQKSGSL